MEERRPRRGVAERRRENVDGEGRGGGHEMSRGWGA